MIAKLQIHVEELRACDRCPQMQKPVVSGGPVISKTMLVGQAPGVKEPQFGRPFAWTAGKTLFKWFEQACAVDEVEFRRTVYMAAVCRCFPGKKEGGGDRVPSPEEIANCASWMEVEIGILRPELVIPVGKLAIEQFMPAGKLDQIIGRKYRVKRFGHAFDLVPLPHPSGASPWHRMEPGKGLLAQAMQLIVNHPGWINRTKE